MELFGEGVRSVSWDRGGYVEIKKTWKWIGVRFKYTIIAIDQLTISRF